MSVRFFEVIRLSNSFQHYSPLPNMPKKSAAHMNKVNEVVRILGITTGLNVPQAMILAGFLKKDTTNETVRRMI